MWPLWLVATTVTSVISYKLWLPFMMRHHGFVIKTVVLLSQVPLFEISANPENAQ